MPIGWREPLALQQRNAVLGWGDGGDQSTSPQAPRYLSAEGEHEYMLTLPSFFSRLFPAFSVCVSGKKGVDPAVNEFLQKARALELQVGVPRHAKAKVRNFVQEPECSAVSPTPQLLPDSLNPKKKSMFLLRVLPRLSTNSARGKQAVAAPVVKGAGVRRLEHLDAGGDFRIFSRVSTGQHEEATMAASRGHAHTSGR
ncbi:hypothetical protein MRX96_049390, partial [Rhipicephalus microplus]